MGKSSGFNSAKAIVAMLGMATSISACPEPNETAPPITSLEQLEPKLVKAYCENVVQCSPGSELGFIAALLGDTATCSALMGPISGGAFEDFQAAKDRGALNIDLDVFAACLDNLAPAAFCKGFEGLEGLCPAAFEGTVVAAGDCNSDLECSSGLYCNTDTCPGKCTVQVAVGEPCTTRGECVYTSPTAGRAECVGDTIDRTCALLQYSDTLVGVGEPCGRTGDAPNYVQVECSEDMYCERAAGADVGVCRESAAVGETCGDGVQCAGLSVCTQADTGRTCVAVKFEDTEGATCIDEERIYCNSVSGLYCNTTTAKCATWGDGTVGAFCPSGVIFDPPGVVCNLGNYCDETSNVCAPLKEDGQDCIGSGECISENCDTTGKCIAKYACPTPLP